MTLKTINLRNRISLDAQQDREVKTMIILLSVFISALIFGISLTNQNKEIIADVFNNINKDSHVFTDIFIKSFFANLILLIIIFIAGFSSIGITAVVLSIVIKAFAIGCSCSFFVSECGLSGIGMFLLTVFPSNIIYVVTLLLASDLSILQSIDILSLIYEKNQNKIMIRKYIYKILIFVILILVGAVSESFLYIIFRNLF